MQKFNLLDRLLDYPFVPKCGGCRIRMDKTDTGLCKKCRNIYEDEKAEYCDFCGMEIAICNCVPPNLLVNACYNYRKLVFYKPGGEVTPMRRMIYGIKRGYNMALIRFFANELAALDNDFCNEDVIVTYAPRTKKAVKEYGYDQAHLLAKYYAKYGGYKFMRLLNRKRIYKQSEQKLLNFKQRAKNVKGAFYICNEDAVLGKTIVLIDDVVTSGATVGECADLLYMAGAKNVICRSVAYTYRKNKHKSD